MSEYHLRRASGEMPGKVSTQNWASVFKLPATWLASAGVCFRPSLSLGAAVCASLCSLEEGILPSWLLVPRVMTLGPTLEWQPQPSPFQL